MDKSSENTSKISPVSFENASNLFNANRVGSNWINRVGELIKELKYEISQKPPQLKTEWTYATNAIDLNYALAVHEFVPKKQ